jgi:hypothetical protein
MNPILRVGTHLGRRRSAAVLLVFMTGLTACEDGSQLDPSADELAVGTWGGDNVGVVVSASSAHVHVGCTNGDFPSPIALDVDRRFSVSGEYLLEAFPVAVGPTMPAQFAGVLQGDLLTLTIAVNDTIRGELVVLGPVTVEFGREPAMEMCPICRDGDGD